MNDQIPKSPEERRLNQESTTAYQAVVAAGEIIREGFSTLHNISRKPDRSLVTERDRLPVRTSHHLYTATILSPPCYFNRREGQDSRTPI